MSTETRPAGRKTLRAAPYWITLSFAPLVVLAVMQGGWTILLIPFYGWVLMTLLDSLLGPDPSNADLNTPEADLIWFRLLTWIWMPLQAALLFGTIWYLTHGADHSALEIIGIMFGIGVTTGTVGIVYAHELFHKTNRYEPILGDLLLAMVLYGHFRTEHMIVHHPYVGTGRDTVTARYSEGFHRYFPRVLRQGLGSAWRAEAAMLARRRLPGWHWRNPMWKYLALASVALALAFAVGGWLGIGLFAFQAFVAVWQLELTNYVEHYGLTRKYLGDNRYEPVQPHHSWDSVYGVSNLLLINLQRHADHHCHPTRRFPLLQSYPASEVPRLTHGYPLMTAMAMIPPLWRRKMNPRVRAWRHQFYPEIEDWTAYRSLSQPVTAAAEIRAMTRNTIARDRLTLWVNGRAVSVIADPLDRLSHILRDRLGLTGLKEGCCEGECGACTVLVDDRPVASCLMLGFQAEGVRITTIEGLGQGGGLSGLQQAFLSHGAVQCGYCTPGMVMAAEGHLRANPDGDRAAIRHALAGNICRCTGFALIVDAVESEAARRLADLSNAMEAGA